jgi:phosphoribosylformylglycinamidine synthase
MQPNNKSFILGVNTAAPRYYIVEYQLDPVILMADCFAAFTHRKIIDAVCQLFGQDLVPISAGLQNQPFVAPYTNFITTDSTTLIEIIKKCRLLESKTATGVDTGAKIIRIETIQFVPLGSNSTDSKPINYDKLTHRIYNSLAEYQELINTNLEAQQHAQSDFQTSNGMDFMPLPGPELAAFFGTDSNPESLTGLPPVSKFEREDWLQCNSEHSRHWFFRTPIPYLGQRSLFDLVKSTLTDNSIAQENSLVAFSDNSSAVKSCIVGPANYLTRTGIGASAKWHQSLVAAGMNPCLTAETHNFPTYYHPFEGANTGIGGRIRDNLAVGTGSLSSASWAGYSMSDLKMVLAASDGASNYANKVGEPLLGGYLRWHPMFAKPILYTAGIGWISANRLLTSETRPQIGDLIIKVGPQAFKIGLGGSLMSSVDNQATGAQDALTAVQRGDPYEGNKVIRFCEYLATQPGAPIIHKIHDQGAGGLGNVVKELIEPNSAVIDLSQLPRAPGMSTLECWLSEYQEQMLFTCADSSLDELQKLADREGCGLYVLGQILPPKGNLAHQEDPVIHLTGVQGEKYDFYYRRLAEHPLLNNRFNPILGEMTSINTSALIPSRANPEGIYSKLQEAANYLKHHIQPQHDLKLWLTTKIDRSVGGCVIQQSHVGPYGLPMSDYGILAANPDGSGGWQVSALGENIWVGQPPKEFSIKCIAELVANLSGSGIQDLVQVKLSANWMWYIKSPEYCQLMVECAEHLVNGLRGLDMAIDGGKDSLSMSIDMPDGERIVSPPTLVLAGYASLPSWTRRVSPVLSATPETYLWSLDLMELFRENLLSKPASVKAVLGCIFAGIRDGTILAIHDGDKLGETVEEMCLVSEQGFATEFSLDLCEPETELSRYMHHWLVWQSGVEPPESIRQLVGIRKLGQVLPNSREIYSNYGTWISRCHTIFTQRLGTTCEFMPWVGSEYLKYQPWEYRWSDEVMDRLPTAEEARMIGKGRRVAIIRDMGSNSHREMAAVFVALGCSEVLDITINDLLVSTDACQELLECDGIVFVGGFAYGDVLGSGEATAQVIRANPALFATITNIAQNSNKFILGVCNGAQIILALRLLPIPESTKITLEKNNSGRFESWFLPVKMADGQQLGIWCAHGEGRFTFTQEPPVQSSGEGRFLIAPEPPENLELVGKYTSQEYPANPNGSQFNAIGIRTKYEKIDGNLIGGAQIIALMPHPERSVYKHQCEYIPPELVKGSNQSPFTPWIEFFADLFNTY